MRILITNGRLVDPKNKIDDIADIYIENGVITDVGKDLDYDSSDLEKIDASGMIVVPGLVDMHCHLRDPGLEYKEDIESGTKSAAMGGFTSIACMPNTKPVIDNKVVVEYVLSMAKKNGVVNVFPIGAITKGLLGTELAEIGEMKFAGVVAVSDDGKPVENANLMRNAMQYAYTFDVPVISHCEDLTLQNGGSMNDGELALKLGLRGIPTASEEVIVAREVILSQNTGAPIHIAHVSTKGSVEIVRQAKKHGVKVTCETCPHYFSLTEDAVMGYNTNAKINPPLRTAEDVEAIKEGLRDGTIDVIATDHAPHHIDEKNCEFDRAMSGIVGFETAFPLAYTNLVETGVLTLSQLLEKMTINPAKILGINKGSLEIGRNADIVIVDTENEYAIDVSSFKSKSKNSPFNGFAVKGKTIYTLVDGKLVVAGGELY